MEILGILQESVDDAFPSIFFGGMQSYVDVSRVQ